MVCQAYLAVYKCSRCHSVKMLINRIDKMAYCCISGNRKLFIRQVSTGMILTTDCNLFATLEPLILRKLVKLSNFGG